MITQPPLQPAVFVMDLWHMFLWIIGAVAVSRFSSHSEHRKNLKEVRDVHACIDRHMNGADGEPGVVDRLARIEQMLEVKPEGD